MCTLPVIILFSLFCALNAAETPQTLFGAARALTLEQTTIASLSPALQRYPQELEKIVKELVSSAENIRAKLGYWKKVTFA